MYLYQYILSYKFNIEFPTIKNISLHNKTKLWLKQITTNFTAILYLYFLIYYV